MSRKGKAQAGKGQGQASNDNKSALCNPTSIKFEVLLLELVKITMNVTARISLYKPVRDINSMSNMIH